MMFQFQCPQGHLLETDEAYAGQPCQCPYCGSTFPIPTPSLPAGTRAPPAIAPAPSHEPPGFTPPGHSPPSGPPAPFPTMQPAPRSHVVAAPVPFSPPTDKPEILHIPCPNGHELETPRDMLNQDVLCPLCNVQFRLREKDSVEYKRRQQQEQERRERRAARMWLNYAIVAAVLVTLGILGLIIVSAST